MGNWKKRKEEADDKVRLFGVKHATQMWRDFFEEINQMRNQLNRGMLASLNTYSSNSYLSKKD